MNVSISIHDVSGVEFRDAPDQFGNVKELLILTGRRSGKAAAQLRLFVREGYELPVGELQIRARKVAVSEGATPDGEAVK